MAVALVYTMEYSRSALHHETDKENMVEKNCYYTFTSIKGTIKDT